MIRRFRFLFILIPVLFLSAAAFTTMGLWNWLMPSLFGFGTLTFLKALGIFVLARLFFGGRGWGGWRARRFAFAGHRHKMSDEDWQAKMQAKWSNMNPEQRERFSARCGSRFGFGEKKAETEQ